MVFTEIKPHYHQRHEEIIYIISGRGKMRIGAKESIAGPGSVFVIPPGMVHSYVNLGPRPSIGISIFCPPFDGKDRVFVSSGD
jgi:quercetin dioxygenase-like cupin family protein